MNRNFLLLAVAGLLLLGGGGIAVYQMTRGLRNNNPGNIEDDGVTAWEGLADPHNDGAGYLVFTDPRYGIRAMAHVLENAVTLDGVAPTLTGLITHYAPPPQNDTAAYIADVSTITGWAVDEPIAVPGAGLLALIPAMIHHENGLQPYDSATIAAGVNLA